MSQKRQAPTTGIYSIKAIIWRFISICALTFFFPRQYETSYAVGSVLMSRYQITFQNENISSTFWDIVENERKNFMPSWRQLWCHDCIYDVMDFCRIFDVEHLRNEERYRRNSFTAGIYSINAIIRRFISTSAPKKCSKISRIVVRRWKRLNEQKSHHFSECKYFINFLRCRRKYGKNFYAELASIMKSWLQLWRSAFFESLTSIFSGTERDTDNSFTVGIYSTNAMIWRFIFIIGKKNNFLRYHEKSYAVYKRLDEQKSDHFSEWKYLINFLRYRRKCATFFFGREGVNYDDVMIAIMT